MDDRKSTSASFIIITSSRPPISRLQSSESKGHTGSWEPQQHLYSIMAEASECLKKSNSKEILHPDMSEAGAAGLTMKVKPRRNLVLFGSRGTEKTLAAEVILDQTDLPPASSPSECVKHEAEVCGHQVSVLHMPPLYDKPPEEVMEESFRCVSLCDPEGVHAFILVLPVAPLTDEDKGELQTIQDTFSPRVKDFIMILFTVDSDPAAPAVVNFIKETKEIQELCQSCGGRYVVLNIKNKKQILQLLQTVDQTCSEASRSFTKESLTRANMERVLKLQADLQDVRHKVDTDGDLRECLEEKEEEMKKKEEEMKKKEEEMKKKHKEERKTLRAQAEQERKQRVQQLKEKDECLQKEREKRKKEAEEEEKRRRKQEEAQRQKWKQKLEAAERRAQSERAERDKAESKLEQNRREMKRNRDVWEKEKDQIWERVLQDQKQNMDDLKNDLEEERSSHRKLQEEYNKKWRKWVYPWIFLLPLLFYLLVQFLTTQGP